MSQSFSKKIIEIAITLKGGTFEGEGATKTFKGFACNVTVTKPGLPDKNTALVDIYGLSQETMAQLAQLNPKPLASPNSVISVRAGNDGSHLALIYRGDITHAWADFSQAPNPFMHFEAGTGDHAQQIPDPPMSVTDSADVHQLFAHFAQKAGYTYEKNANVTGSVKNAHLSGSAYDKMIGLAKLKGYDLIVDDGNVTVCPLGEARFGAAESLDTNNGLVNYPKLTETGIQCRCLFNPNLMFGGLVKVKSTVPGANGTWVITKLTHYLTSYIPDASAGTTTTNSISSTSSSSASSNSSTASSSGSAANTSSGAVTGRWESVIDAVSYDETAGGVQYSAKSQQGGGNNNQEVKGTKRLTSGNTMTNAVSFLVEQMIRDTVNTAEVVSIDEADQNSTGGAAGYADATPLVCQTDGFNNTLPQTSIPHMPFFRPQAGKAAIVMDPQPGDKAILLAMKRDSTGVVTGKGDQVQPGSFRTYDLADGYLLNGFLGQAPEIWLELNPATGNISLSTKAANIDISCRESGNIEITTNSGDVDIATKAGNIGVSATGEVTVDVPQAIFTGDVWIQGSLVFDGEAMGLGNGPAKFRSGIINYAGGIANTGGLTNSGGIQNTGGNTVSNNVTVETHLHSGVMPGGGATQSPVEGT